MALLFFGPGYLACAQDIDQLKIGLQADGRVIVPTNQVIKPAGKQVTFPGRPVDLAFLEHGKITAIKNMHDIVFVETASGKILQTVDIPKSKLSVVGLVNVGGKVYVSDSMGLMQSIEFDEDGFYKLLPALPLEKIKLEGEPDYAGIAKLSDEQIFVTCTRGNFVQLVDIKNQKAGQIIPVGVAPYTVAVVSSTKAYISNWGGDHPKANDPQRSSSGTPTRVDERTGISNHGSVSIIRKENGTWKESKSITVGLHPSGMILSKNSKRLYVANANSDTVSVIDTDTDEVLETIFCRPESRLPFGSASNALALSPEGGTLYVANGTNNCIAVVRLSAKSSEGMGEGRPEKSQVLGLIPTGWYPGAILLNAEGTQLIVANVKGLGSLNQKRIAEKGHNSHDHLGSISIIDVPDAKTLAKYTEEVNTNNRLNYSLAGLEKPRPDAKPLVIPQRHGEPSLIKHVVYIIKENRTYDQVLGDMKEGNGDAHLCIFGENTTPNHHKLAREFTLLDNFYCSGVLSADGHSWTDSAYVTDYLEKAFGGFPRSYPDDGRDPLAFAPTGFIWDNALLHKKTIRNYGEHISEEPYFPKGTRWTDFFNDYKNGTRKVPITIKINDAALKSHTHPTYPYFPLHAPDVYRAELFKEDLKAFEKAGKMPDLILMSLPCNHTDGTTPDFPTPRAMVADNDLALGRIVEAISASSFWKDTCILVVEDDPQAGFDHVDGHRTVAFAISPYTKRKYVDHTSYNQTGMVKTIEMMLGLPPMNQMDLSATPMRGCFSAEPDLTPYKVVNNKIALDEMNPPLKKLTGKALFWAEKSVAMNFEQADVADEDTFNRILWHSVKGYDSPYPERFVRKKADGE
ncbi:bifunctional YncE family protein/alkaline phosphatase family protein [Telmatocola sphagniphila]|uniref:Bifunctional YncE family protein/alkaline phosphatase family protein n=2 Tax=Telmatocola sphagniphila TaxID=1123043 RepID=A0A8E6EXJ5_9BACT|nr:bifunctional YncE family protein/alkaline phosphatase family protein [Telmatocola sphagniphila]